MRIVVTIDSEKMGSETATRRALQGLMEDLYQEPGELWVQAISDNDGVESTIFDSED